MAVGFDFMKFADDVGKGVCDVAGGAASAVAGAADAVGSAVAAAFPKPTQPATQYSENMHKGNHVATQTILVCRVGGKDYKGRDLPEKSQSIRMSKDGIELLVGQESSMDIVKRFVRQESSMGVVKKLSVRNCAVYANGKTGPDNPLFNAVGGGFGGAVASRVINPALVPAGAAIGAAVGVAEAFQTEDVWYIDILEHDGTEWTFRLDKKSDGDDLIEFLDTHYAL